MRADRLLSLLMLLQARGRITAKNLAEELEVSERTIYRDIDALSAAGVPVYAERGPGGGCALLDSYRTTLTGLTKDEARALFMLSIPASLDELGVSQELKAALRKLSAALPDSRRADEAHVRQRIHLDSSVWFQQHTAIPHLKTLQHATWEDRKLHLTHRLIFGNQAEKLVAPYGLVAKANVWHLVYAYRDDIRILRVSRILEARLTDEIFVRPTDFNLRAFWQIWCTAYEQNRPEYPVRVRVSPELFPLLPQHLGERTRPATASAGPPDAAGWFTLTLPFETLEEARRQLLHCGGALEVLEPLALRKTVADFGAQIAARYQAGEKDGG